MNGPSQNNSEVSNSLSMSGGHMTMASEMSSPLNHVGSLPPNAVAPTASSMSSIIKQESIDSPTPSQDEDIKPPMPLANSNPGEILQVYLANMCVNECVFVQD